MKKIFVTFCILALLMGANTSCQKVEIIPEEIENVTGQSPEFTVTATIEDPETKVSFEESSGHNLKPSWSVHDIVIGFDDSGNTYGYEVTGLSGGRAILNIVTSGDYVGSKTTNPANGTKMYMIYAPGKKPSDIYASTKKLLVSIENQAKDVVPAIMIASATVADDNLSLSFKNKTAIIGIKSPKMAAGNQHYSSITLSGNQIKSEVLLYLDGEEFKASYSKECPITKAVDFTSDLDTRKGPDVTYIVTCPAETASDLLFSTDNGESFKKSGKTMTAGNYYYMTPSFGDGDYLCFTPQGSGVEISLNKVGSPTVVHMEYSKNKTIWNDLFYGDHITLSSDEKMYVRAKSLRTTDQSETDYVKFSITGNTEVSGNISYMVDPDGALEQVPSYCFYRLFSDCPITTASNLKLHAMGFCCYAEMFKDCTVFGGAPALPAKRLSYGCYANMFYGCESLLTAPVLPAPHLARGCYSRMFYGCSRLTSVTCYALHIDPLLYATESWLSGVSKIGVFIKYDIANWETNSASGIPTGWVPFAKSTQLGEFRVSDSKKVSFSKGNLRYTVSTDTWDFFDNQYDCASGYDSGVISLFTWGYNATLSIVPDGTDADNVSRSSGNLTADTEDWGCKIGTPGTWRTLTDDEWTYLLNTRVVNRGTGAGHSYLSVMESGFTPLGDWRKYYGIFLFPDNYAGGTDLHSLEGYSWTEITANGVVFLPAAGVRTGSNVSDINSAGLYWTSTACEYPLQTAYDLFITNTGSVSSGRYNYRAYGQSVRLVTDIVP